MTEHRKRVGMHGEEIATAYLIDKGYKILERNYSSKLGEIDIIAKENGCLAFVEVKTRMGNSFGLPKDAVTPQKRRKLSMLALEYLKKTKQLGHSSRFDVVAVHTRTNDGHTTIELIRNAFDLAY
ncbi:MAG: YraN family protein [Pseudomonadota bacterium]